MISQGDYASVRLEDAKTGELFAIAPVRPSHPVPVEAVIDSSRFFVLRIEDSPPDAQPHTHTKAGCSPEPHPHARHAFIGLGFRERPLAFDFQEAVYDHVKYVNKKKEAEALGEEYERRPSKDMRIKEGQTLHLSLKTVRREGQWIDLHIHLPVQAVLAIRPVMWQFQLGRGYENACGSS